MSSAATYDPIAAWYHQHWSEHFQHWAMQVLDRMLLAELPPGSRILDLCCGTGTVAAALTERGYAVTGVDASARMLEFARQRAPRAQFVHADASRFALDRPVDAAVSTFDSLNHILDPAQLAAAFHRVAEALPPNRVFVFDVNMKEAYETVWARSGGDVTADGAYFMRGEWHPETGVADTHLTIFQPEGELWRRADTVVRQRLYEPEQLRSMLEMAGFQDVQIFDPEADLDLGGAWAEGRAVVHAIRK